MKPYPVCRLFPIAALFATACAGNPTMQATSAPMPSATSATADASVLPTLPAPVPISQAEYAQRRARLAAAMDDGFLVVFGSAAPVEDYLPFNQNTPFRYLTGFMEPEASLVIVKENGEVREQLFVQARDPSREVWEGNRLGAMGAERVTGIPTQPVSDFMPTVDALAARFDRFYTLLPDVEELGDGMLMNREEQLVEAIRSHGNDIQLVSLDVDLQRIRSGKTEAEMDLIRRAVLITNLAHREAMRTVTPGMNEFEIQALIEYIFRRYGADRPAFSSIVGSGPNTTTLHYRGAERFMNEGELLVMDIGASYRGYAADVTRTIPVSGHFNADQRRVYEIVLEALLDAEREIRIGDAWTQLDQAAGDRLQEGLTELGLIDEPGATYYCENPRVNNQCPQYRLYYMHALGHGIGLDVHDPDLSYFGTFDIGSAFTLEPGLYIRSDVLDFLPDTAENRAMIERLRPAVQRYQNIGVRIEESYLITDEGTERLSAAAPRQIDEIEALMAERGLGENFRRPETLEWYRATTPN